MAPTKRKNPLNDSLAANPAGLRNYTPLIAASVTKPGDKPQTGTIIHNIVKHSPQFIQISLGKDFGSFLMKNTAKIRKQVSNFSCSVLLI